MTDKKKTLTLSDATLSMLKVALSRHRQAAYKQMTEGSELVADRWRDEHELACVATAELDAELRRLDAEQMQSFDDVLLDGPEVK